MKDIDEKDYRGKNDLDTSLNLPIKDRCINGKSQCSRVKQKIRPGKAPVACFLSLIIGVYESDWLTLEATSKIISNSSGVRSL